jgi:hypothetical protein
MGMRTSAWLIMAALAVTACAASPTSEPPAGMLAEPISGAHSGPPPELGDAASEFDTDWSRSAVDYAEIISGGVGKDGIGALISPEVESVPEADLWLTERDPVIAVVIDSAARAYPLAILMWHEIANDVLRGRPIAVTYCPLCNAAVVFDRRVGGVVAQFGVSGFLRHSDLIMYDRGTESLWQQLDGRAIVGDFTGTRLTEVGSALMSWADFRNAFVKGSVLARPTASTARYGANPYVAYDSLGGRPFLLANPPDSRLPAMERVVTLQRDDETAAYPYSRLAIERVIHDRIAGLDVVVLWKPGAASALDTATISDGRDVGVAAVFERRLDDASSASHMLTFEALDDGLFVDIETGSVWNIAGHAVGGALAGAELQGVPHGNPLWFAWAAFHPQTAVRAGAEAE